MHTAYSSESGDMMSNIDSFADSISNELNAYSMDLSQVIVSVAKEVGKEALEMLKSISPKDTPDYYSKWRMQIKSTQEMAVMLVIYNKKYQLTHLLEFGHASVNGGRASAEPHIARVQDWINKEFETRLSAALGE